MIVLRIFLIVLTFIIALGIGLLLRRLLVHHLKKTVLDNWLVQTLGIIAVFPPLILAAIAIPIILGMFTDLWHQLKLLMLLHSTEVTSLIWGIIETVLIIALGIGIARTIKTLTIRGLGENRIDINTRTLVGRIFYILTLILVVLWTLSIWQIPLTGAVTFIGVLTVVLSVAIQEILKDLVAGFYILMEHPFRIGDQVSVGSIGSNTFYTGKVEDVQLRATKLRLLSGEEATIPNSLVFSGVVVNTSFYGERRATITITMPQEEFVKEETPEKALKALKEVDAVMAKPEPMIVLNGYTGNKLTLTLRFWFADNQLSALSEVMYTLRTYLPNADFVVQEPAGNI